MLVWYMIYSGKSSPKLQWPFNIWFSCNFSPTVVSKYVPWKRDFYSWIFKYFYVYWSSLWGFSIVIVGLGIFLNPNWGISWLWLMWQNSMAITLCQKKVFSLAYVFKNIKSESEMWNVTDTADWVVLYLLFYPTLFKLSSKPSSSGQAEFS